MQHETKKDRVTDDQSYNMLMRFSYHFDSTVGKKGLNLICILLHVFQPALVVLFS